VPAANHGSGVSGSKDTYTGKGLSEGVHTLWPRSSATRTYGVFDACQLGRVIGWRDSPRQAILIRLSAATTTKRRCISNSRAARALPRLHNIGPLAIHVAIAKEGQLHRLHAPRKVNAPFQTGKRRQGAGSPLHLPTAGHAAAQGGRPGAPMWSGPQR
jgi:hypothetical protein